MDEFQLRFLQTRMEALLREKGLQKFQATSVIHRDVSVLAVYLDINDAATVLEKLPFFGSTHLKCQTLIAHGILKNYGVGSLHGVRVNYLGGGMVMRIGWEFPLENQLISAADEMPDYPTRLRGV